MERGSDRESSSYSIEKKKINRSQESKLKQPNYATSPSRSNSIECDIIQENHHDCILKSSQHKIIPTFSKPMTYDPQLLKRTHHSSCDSIERRKQLNYELGLSDDEEDKSISSKVHGIEEMNEKLQSMTIAFQQAKENEERVNESLANLQLLNRSQVAILKSSHLKQLQVKENRVLEMENIIQELEMKLKDASIPYNPYERPSETSPLQVSTYENQITIEMNTLQKEIESLRLENKQLKSMELKDTKDDSNMLKQENKKLEIEVKNLQDMITTLRNQSKEQNIPPGPINIAEIDEYKNIRMKLQETTVALDEAKKRIEILEGSSRTSTSSMPSTESGREKLIEEQLHIAEKKLVEALHQLKLNENLAEEKYKKLKATAESELAKIKDQARKAVTDLKRKLETQGKNAQIKRQAPLKVIAQQCISHKSDLETLRAQVVQLNEHFPIYVAQIVSKVSKKIQVQSQAMAGIVDNYARELKERKRLFNLVQELKGNIRVLARIRPVSKSEMTQGSKVVSQVSTAGDELTLSGEKGKTKTWEFDRVFDVNSTQDEVFMEVKPLVTSILDGYSVCIFAYGQTGSGKTFTMTGVPQAKGINTRSLQELFERKAERQTEFKDILSVSILEIYNEQIRDLLTSDSSQQTLAVRQGPSGNYVPGLTTIAVNTLDDVFALIQKGEGNRSTHATDMNEHSSRSHSILSIEIKSTNHVTHVETNGKLFLVDLAGSERLSKTGAAGQRLKEAQNINKSLSALGDVIAARASKQKHVPYRNSTLTYLLQDALGGDSKTLMVACASPVDYNADESFCTLNFAARARSVELGKATRSIVSPGSKE